MSKTPLELFEKRIINLEKVVVKQEEEIKNIKAAIEELRADK